MSQVPQDSYGQQSALGIPPGFFSSLFDMGFTKYITSSVLKFLYWLVVILATLGAIGGILSSLVSGSVFLIVAALIFFPIVWLVELIFARVGLEIIMVIFRMHDDLAAIRLQGQVPPAAPTVSYQSYPQQAYEPPPDHPTERY